MTYPSNPGPLESSNPIQKGSFETIRQRNRNTKIWVTLKLNCLGQFVLQNVDCLRHHFLENLSRRFNLMDDTGDLAGQTTDKSLLSAFNKTSQ